MRKILLLAFVAVLTVIQVSAQRTPTKVIDNKGTIKWVLDTSSKFFDTAYNGLTKVNDSTLVLGGKLTQVTTIDIDGKKFQLANLIAGSGTDSLIVADPATGELKRISASRLFGNLTAKNGMYKDADSIKLGGALTEATTISSSTLNSLTLASGGLGSIKITGLTSGAASDSLLVIDPVTNNVRYVSKSTLLNGLFAKNGLTKSGDSLLLGGTLDRATEITTSAANTLALQGLQSGSLATDSLVVSGGSDGVLKRVAASSLLQSGEVTTTSSGSTTTITAAGMPADASRVWVYRNGAKLVKGVDFSVATGVVTLIQSGWTDTNGDVYEVQWVK